MNSILKAYLILANCLKGKFCWWCYLTPSGEWRRGDILWRLNNLVTSQGLDQRSKIEKVVPKMARRIGSDAGQSRKWVDLAVDDRRRCQKNSHSVLHCMDKRTKERSDLNKFAQCQDCQLCKIILTFFQLLLNFVL